MAAQSGDTAGGSGDPNSTKDASGRGIARLGPFLAWAVVFADIGTSIYYVPGILYSQVGGLAPAFVLVTTVVFVLVAFEHLEVAHRFPEGGGGVAAARAAFGPKVALLSGALMVSAYLLAIALAVVSALRYLAAIQPWPMEVRILAVFLIVGLGWLNWLGVREMARLALVAALVALGVNGALIVAVVSQLGPEQWAELFGNLGQITTLNPATAATGFAGAWLAYSGLESLAQLAPAIRSPRERVIRLATGLVVGSVFITVPLLTALAVEAAQAGHIAARGALLAPVALQYGGRHLLLAVSVSAATLLLLAAHVAFIACYHILNALGEEGYLPAVVARRDPVHGTPRGAIVVITLGASALVLGTSARLPSLGELFAFGLLGSYTLTALSIDRLRWREGRRGLLFWLGVLASFALAIPWVTSWFTKWKATAYGAATVTLMVLVAVATRKGWIRAGRLGYLRARAAERAAADLPTAGEVLTLAEARALQESYPSSTMVALRAVNPGLCREAARRAKGVGDTAVYVIFVDEIAGLLFPAQTGPSEEAQRVLAQVVQDFRAEGIDAIPLWRVAHDAGASIAEAAEELGVKCVIMGTTQRSAVLNFLRGDVLKRLAKELPESIHVVICE